MLKMLNTGCTWRTSECEAMLLSARCLLAAAQLTGKAPKAANQVWPKLQKNAMTLHL